MSQPTAAEELTFRAKLGRKFGISVKRAWALWFLMRGGIEDEKTLISHGFLLSTIDFSELFLFLDNCEEPIPEFVELESAQHIYCRNCGQRAQQVPCGVCKVHGRGEHLTTQKPVGESLHDKLRRQTFGEDRHWNNAHAAISRSEQQYHGSSSF